MANDARSGDGSLAALLDELRPLVDAARHSGQRPRTVVLPPQAYAAVAAVKAGDRERGMPMMIFGLEVMAGAADDPVPRVV